MRHATLAVGTLGHGPPVVLLHGLAASERMWGAAFDELGAHHHVVVPDLLGFGASPKPPGDYGPDEHAAAVLATLDDLDATEPAVVVGHSLGALIGIHLAVTHPERVAAVVGFATPLYRDEGEARRHIGRLGFMARAFSLDTVLADRICKWVCDHRRLAASIAVITRPDLPAPVARDGVQHTWPSYSGSLRNVVLSANARAELERLPVPAHLVTGTRDRISPPGLIDDLPTTSRVTIETWVDAGHDLPLTEPGRCVETIRRVATMVNVDG